MRRLTLLILIVFFAAPTLAQNDPAPVITADNVTHLQSVTLVNFEEPNKVIQYPGVGYTVPRPQDEIHETYWKPDFQTGWFAFQFDSNAVVLSTNQAIYSMSIWEAAKPFYTDWTGFNVDATNIIDFYYQYDMSAWVTRGADSFYVKLDDFQAGGIGAYIQVESDAIPLSIWTDCQSDAWGDCGAWLEVEYVGSNARTVIVRLPYINELEGSSSVSLNDNELDTFPYAPAQDPEAVVRIGRIPPPYVVTSSIDGMVKLWNIQTGEVLYEVDNGTGQPSVFGNINADATHLVWRDNANETLYLLDFTTGENREIASLNGAYAQWFFLSNDASTILAVNLNHEPVVVAWDVATGEETVLGEYRDCNRPQPDMARLSRDGTTLVIGCDTGLDVWRVVADGAN